MKIALLMFGAVMLSACTSAQIAAFEADVNAGSKAIVSAEPLACDIADVTDPQNAKAICQELDDAGNIIGTLPVVIEPIVALQNLVKLHPAKTAATRASLADAKAKLLRTAK